MVWVRSLVPKEKNSAVSAISAARKAGARQFDHGADQIVRHGAAGLLDVRRYLGDAGGEPVQFRLEAHQRDHDLELDRLAAAGHDIGGGFQDGAGLHFIDFGG